MKLQNLPILLSVILTGVAIPLTLLAVKTNQDTRSQAMIKQAPLPTIKPINPVFTSPTPKPTPAPLPSSP
ncbi:hypothetical protein HZB97_02325 [Candidatus Gottesmanbacteria bacterium]|nr:hypothetical protein [Candidatus Gottesmanbacteria bacterium]MBI5465638.1 hypothetical protein [Candidatus Gottesmanbacteria bacterium]